MKCQVVVDEKGKIVAVGYGDPPELETEALTTKSGPVVEENQTLVELDMPEEFDEDASFVCIPLSFKLNVPEKLPENPSLPQLPPKKEHSRRPNNKIRNRNNASVFIV